MNIKKFISHPYTLVSSFFLIIISGPPAGGIYFLYLVIGMPYGAVSSILGMAGITVILFSHFKYKKYNQSMDECFINLVGAILLILSLFLFFYNDAERFNISRYWHLGTLLSIFIFCILTTCFVTIIRKG